MTKRPAAVLLISLLMMATITAATIGISILITSDSQQTRAVEQYIGATLAADSGVERGLAIVAAERDNGDFTTAIAQAGVDTRRGLVDATSAAGFTVTATSASLPQPISLTTGAAYDFDMISNVGGDTNHIPAKMQFSSATLSTGTIEVSWTLITDQGSTTQQGRAYITPDQYYTGGIQFHLDLTNVYQYNNNVLQPVSWSHIVGYRIRLRAINGSVNGLMLVPQDTAGASLAATATVKSIKLVGTGLDGDARAEKQAQIIWQRPSSGIFNYVLFSEGDIIPSL